VSIFIALLFAQTHEHTQSSHAQGIERENERGGRNKEERKQKREGEKKTAAADAIFPKFCLLKPITPIIMHTYFNGYFDCIIFND
jgi:hypothetical protein